jgi:hypothetical protein
MKVKENVLKVCLILPSVVKAGKPFSDYELICEIQVKNGLDLGENNRNINGCKIFAASIAQTLVDKQVKFQYLSYKLGLGKSLTELWLKKFKKPWAWTCPNFFSTLVSPAGGHLGFSIGPKNNNTWLAACNDHSSQFSIPSSMYI